MVKVSQTSSLLTSLDAILPDLLSRRRKPLLYVVLSLCLLAPLLATTWLSLSQQRHLAEETYRFEMASKADVLADGLGGVMWNLNVEAGLPLVDSVFRDPRIVSIEVRSDRHGPVIRRIRPADARVPTQSLFRDVTREGERVGQVVLTHQTALESGLLRAENIKLSLVTAAQVTLGMLFAIVVVRFAGRAERATALEATNQDLNAYIEEHRRTEQALRESEARMRAMIENSPSMIAVKGLDGRYTIVNRRTEAFLRLSRDQIIGKRRADVLPPHVVDLPDDTEVLNSSQGIKRNVRAVGPDGIERDYVVLSYPILGDDGAPIGIGFTATDISDIRLAEEALREKHRHLELVIDSVPVLIGHLDRDLRFKLVNRSMQELFGRSESEIIGCHVREVRGEERWTYIKPYLDQVLAGTPVEFESACDAPHLGRRVTRSRYVPEKDADGRVVGLFTLAVDVTEQRAMEAQLVRAQKMESIGQLTGGIAHDFNNILAVALGNLELLEEEVQGQPEALRLVGNSLSAARRGVSLTRQLLSFSRRESERAETVDVNGVIDGVGEMLNRTLSGAIEVETRLSGRLRTVLSDASQLESAILNLAINARDAMPDGGRLTIETADFDVDEYFSRLHPGVSPGPYVRITVSDTGCGMTADIRDRIFEPFFTTKRNGKGTGLGLSMVYAFVKQSKGHIDVYSEPGRGSVFAMYLPVGAASRPEAAESVIGEAAPEGSETILVVEDDETVRDVSQRMLEAHGYHTVCAANGPEALAILDGRQDIDMLFSDVVMPGGMSGADLARRVANDRPNMPILLTSGYPRNAIPADSPFPIIAKPFRADELARLVRRVLDTAASAGT